ncbi:integral membrane sensor signal transduction histidine kinase [Emticicia oligotrophica DSM 17448]|uniref:histidine kinase n=1 Tax=Emticicia oligotrophica (strain DSM 17448 / CIP 109782 / MTCC 6937 / GPTSA100-15) TaxID=929562 RepID=A0ABM5N2Z2_EMTOG|nr:integral membrane sensor signal transduction histidine kinase [Emticicia oligotrophica DSM 17448]
MIFFIFLRKNRPVLNRNTIRLLVLLGTLSITGIIAVQAYWVKRAFDLKEQQFRQTVMISLRNVANRISTLYKLSKFDNPVSQLSSDYYVCNLRIPLDADVLEHYLKEEFRKQNLNTPFEYGIYDCESEKIVYGSYIDANFEENKVSSKPLPKTDKYLNYFGVRFPSKTSYLASKLDIWLISSLITLIVTVFFGYSMFVILQQKRLSEVQRDFVNNMTHEFQTPISTIKIATDVLSQPKIFEQPERFKKYVQIIRQENSRLKTQVESVLNTARLERGKFELNIQLQEIHGLIYEVTEGTQAELEEGLKMEFNAVRSSIYADRTQLVSLIRNLLENAIKYSSKPPNITIRTENTTEGLVLSVIDKGIGIPKESIDKIFKKFYRVPTGNLHNVKGFGLGLSYVNEIAKAHKWQLKVESEVGKGSIFSVIIKQES